MLAALGIMLSLFNNAGMAETIESLPRSAPVGAQITVRGGGYLSGQSVNLHLYQMGSPIDESLGTHSADSAGELFTQVTLPDVPPDEYLLEARSGFSLPLATNSMGVELPPTVTLTPNIGVPGTPVQVDMGSIAAGSVEILYDSIPVLGPVAHSGGPFGAQFLVPADRPTPLGEIVTVDAVARVGSLISARSETTFQSQVPGQTDLQLVSISGPGGTLRGGDTFMVTGQLQFPPNTSPSDYQFTLAWITHDGTMHPANPRPVEVSMDGSFEVEGIAPSLAAGYPQHSAGPTDHFGLVYLNPDINSSGRMGWEYVEYELFDVQPLTIHVTNEEESPLEGAVVAVKAHAWLVPPDYDGEQDGFPTRGPGRRALKSTWAALFARPNQFRQALEGVTTIPETGCPVTLSVGQTDANGDFTFHVQPYINELLDTVAQSVSNLDINTTIPSVGYAQFSVLTNATGLGYALLNDDGICSGRRFDFQYDYNQDLWKLREGPEGEFVTPFNPDFAFPLPFPECTGDISFPADPYMPGMPKTQLNIDGDEVTRILGLRGFSNTNGAALTVFETAQLRLPHLDILFPTPANVHLFFGDQDQGVMVPQGALCSFDGIEYVIDLPGLETLSPQIIDATIVGEVGAGLTMERPLQIEILPGPTWINNAQDYVARSIAWRPDDVRLYAEEPESSQSIDRTLDHGVGELKNDNVTAGAVRETITPSGSSKSRIGAADAQTANQDGEDVDDNTSATSGQPVEIGHPNPVTIVETGKIPLFRYAWGIPPIASATVGADIWFMAEYLYHGFVTLTNSAASVDLTSKATLRAGLDLWFDLSVILDVVSLTAFALPSIQLDMPLVIEDSQFNSSASQSCFTFLLDVAYSVSLGWCDFCLSAGGEENLLTESSCEQPNAKAQTRRGLPQIPSVDRTAIAVDGRGESMLAWGDGSGTIQIQLLSNGIPLAMQAQLAAGPGAMAPDVAYLDANRALVAWAQSSLSEVDFMALGDPIAGAAFQHLVYRLWDGDSWSATEFLTLPTSGDGGVVLAACPAQDANCPAGGEVLAVWVHDVAADITQHDFRLYYALFDGTTWSSPAAVDPTGTAKDIQPTAAYVNGEPVVAWTRNPGVTRGQSLPQLNLNQRHIAYRFLNQPAGAQQAVGLSSAVGSASLKGYPDGSLALAYSVATEADAFVGTRRSLHTARGHSCTDGVCTWSQIERLDSEGRRIFVEKPKIVVDSNNLATVAFRQLGTDWALPGEAPGVLAHTGELAYITYQLDTVETDAIPLSVDGAMNWRVDAALDPVTDSLIVTAVQGVALRRDVLKAMDQPAGKAWGVTTHKLGGSAVTLNQRSLLPDFHLRGAQPSQTWIPTGGSIDMTVQLRNNGRPWDEPQDLTLSAFWDGPAGLGSLAATTSIASLVSGSTVEILLSISLPAEFNPDDQHDLHVVVNPQGQLVESESGNNGVVIPIGDMPVPQNLSVVGDSASGVIIINWDAISDPRVTGYRVYRVNPDDSVLAVGSSDVAGFADFSAYRDQAYEYYAVSHSARLMESAPSEHVAATTFGEVVFRGGFEGAAP